MTPASPKGFVGAGGQAAHKQAKAMVGTAKQQVGISDKPKGETVYQSNEQVQGGRPNGDNNLSLPPAPAPFDAVAYKARVDRDAEEKLIELRKRLREIESEMRGAAAERQQNEQQYYQGVEEQMRAEDVKEAQQMEEQQKQAEAVPQSVKSKQGSSESGRRSRKG